MAKIPTDLIAAAQKSAAKYKINVAAILAVIEVESAGKIFALVKGRNEPLIRFEGHYFHKRVVKLVRTLAVAQGLASPNAGAVKNPNSQVARWAFIEKAAKLDMQAAYESTSWGIGQVMGAHWKWLGYASVLELVETARRGVDGQLELMMRYCDKAGLLPALRNGNWNAFARGYNGSTYKKNAYHTKLAAAYAKWSKVKIADAGKISPVQDMDALVAQKEPELIDKPISAERLLSPQVSECLDDAAADGRISTTELGAGAIAVSGTATAVKETVEAVNETGMTLASLGPWLLLALVTVGFAGYIFWERRRKKVAARQAKGAV